MRVNALAPMRLIRALVSHCISHLSVESAGPPHALRSSAPWRVTGLVRLQSKALASPMRLVRALASAATGSEAQPSPFARAPAWRPGSAAQPVPPPHAPSPPRQQSCAWRGPRQGACVGVDGAG